MKLINLSKFMLIFSTAIIAFSCEKVETPEPMGDAGQTLVKLVADEDHYNLLALDVVSTSQGVNLLEIRRDIPNEAELNKTMTVVIKQDAAVLADFNTAHGTSFIVLPTANYTVDPTNPRVGTDFSVTFQPGEFVKYLKIIIPNATTIDLSKKYAFPFIISSVDGGGKISSQNKAVVELTLKNKYDGVYEVTGTMVDVTNATIVGFYPLLWDLVTSGPNQVIVYDKDYTGTPTHIINTAAGLSQYGSFGLIVNFDLTTNKITSITNFYGQLSGASVRSAVLDPTGVNAYNPATKTIKIKYFLTQGTSYTIRTTFDETWTYTGPR